jgi:hypothetical protein
MEKRFSGYSVAVEWRSTPDGKTTYRKDVEYMPDADTVIMSHVDNLDKLRDISESELNEIMEELETGKTAPKVEDNYPLKSIRNSALK